MWTVRIYYINIYYFNYDFVSILGGSGPLLPVPDKFYSTDPAASLNLAVQVTSKYENQMSGNSFLYSTTTAEGKFTITNSAFFIPHYEDNILLTIFVS